MNSLSNNLYITYVDVNCNFLRIWGQRNRVGGTYIERQLAQLSSALNEMPSVNPVLLKKGKLCYAKYSDGNYYRARVLSDSENDAVHLFFVDYGNSSVVPLSNIRIIEIREDLLLKMAEQVDVYYLAGIVAPTYGWTKQIISEISCCICLEELPYKEVAQIGSMKFIDILFQNEDFSKYLVKKEVAQNIPPNIQSELLLLHSQNRGSAQPGVPNAMYPRSFSYIGEDINMGNKLQQTPISSVPEKSVNYLRQLPQYSEADNSQMVNLLRNNPVGAYNRDFWNGNGGALRASFTSLHYNQFNPIDVKVKTGQLINSYNNLMVQALAHQVKKYIAQENTKSASNEENVLHNYNSTVLEVGSTHSVFVSAIDDGPWSFSVQLLSIQNELNKLIKELTATQLVPIKPPVLLGNPCICDSVLYGNPCRGVIVSISHSAVKVYLVDFGDTENLPVSSIYEIPKKFFKSRVLSHKFCLSGLNKVVYSEDIKIHFTETVQNKLLILQVASLEGDNLPTCELYINDKNIKRILNEKSCEKDKSEGRALQVGQSVSVVVTWVDSLQKFYVQLHSRDDDLNALKEELSLIEENGHILSYEDLKLGLLCACKYKEDDQWYRAKITSFVSEELITVFYIDYGNTEIVGISQLRNVSNSKLINKLRFEVIHCCLKGFEYEPHDQELTNEFEKLTLERDFTMKVVSSDGKRCYVSLSVNDEDIVPTFMKACNRKLDHLRIDNKGFGETEQSTSLTNKSFREAETHENNDSCEQNNNCSIFWRYRRGDEESTNWRNEMQKKSSSQRADDKEDPLHEWKRQASNDRHSSNKNSCDKNSNALSDHKSWRRPNKNTATDGHDQEKFKEHNTLESQSEKLQLRGESKSENNTNHILHRSIGDSEKYNNIDDKDGKEQSAVKQLIDKGEIAPPGSKFEERRMTLGHGEKVMIAYYVNPHEFYIQLLTDDEDFKKMMEDIQCFYSDKYSIKYDLEEGDILIVQFSHDKVLYRAEVVSSKPLVVRYVDYGNQEELVNIQAWAVIKRFLKLPKQVIKCRLANVEPSGSEWIPFDSKLEKLFESEVYKCTFLDCNNGVYDISLKDLNSGKDLAQEIISNGCGVKKPSKLVIPTVDFTLLPSQILRLYVSHVEGPHRFYVILNPDDLRVLEEEISKQENFVSHLEAASLMLGTYCLAACKGSPWFRGIILNIADETVLVNRMDIGDTVKVSKDMLKFLPEDLKVIQPQAIECLMANKSFITSNEFRIATEHKYLPIFIISATSDRKLSVIVFNEDGTKFAFQDERQIDVEPIGQLPITVQELPILMSSFESPDDIHIQRLSDRAKIENLTKRLTDFYKYDKGTVKFEVKKGALVAAKSSCGVWRRGRIVSVQKKTVNVFFIDIGKTEALTKEGIMKLDSSFFHTHALSRKTRLNLTYRPEHLQVMKERLAVLAEMDDLHGSFILDNGEFVMQLTANGVNVTNSLTSNLPVSEKCGMTDGNVNFNENSLKVFVIHIDSPKKFWVHKENSINEFQQFQEKLQAACEVLYDRDIPVVGEVVGALFGGAWYRAIIENIEENIATLRFIDYGNVIQIDLSFEKVKRLMPELIKVPTPVMQFALKGEWKENATTVFEEIIAQYEDPITAQILGEGQPTIVDLFMDGQSITEKLIQVGVNEYDESTDPDLNTVYICHINSPSDFYVQRESSAEVNDKISAALANAEKLEDFLNAREGDLCIAKYVTDGIWYRAKVLNRCDNEIEVIFIDYGNVSKVSEVKRLPPNLAKVRPLAESCCLIFGQRNDKWSEEACAKFSKYSCSHPLKMKVVFDRSKKLIVQLFSKGKNLSEELSHLCPEDGRKEVHVSHVNSPTDFYIQDINDDNIELITNALEAGDECEDLDMEDRIPGQMCLARIDGTEVWYRAKILKCTDVDWQVQFIDSGRTVNANQLKEPMHNIMEIPPRAQKCALDLVERNIPASMKEEFIKTTASGSRVFQARILKPGDPNIISLKLDGRILEDMLSFDFPADSLETKQTGDPCFPE